jgi:hypothetical protein
MLQYSAVYLSARSRSLFLLLPSYLVMTNAGLCRVVGLQFGLQYFAGRIDLSGAKRGHQCIGNERGKRWPRTLIPKRMTARSDQDFRRLPNAHQAWKASPAPQPSATQ